MDARRGVAGLHAGENNSRPAYAISVQNRGKSARSVGLQTSKFESVSGVVYCLTEVQ